MRADVPTGKEARPTVSTKKVKFVEDELMEESGAAGEQSQRSHSTVPNLDIPQQNNAKDSQDVQM